MLRYLYQGKDVYYTYYSNLYARMAFYFVFGLVFSPWRSGLLWYLFFLILFRVAGWGVCWARSIPVIPIEELGTICLSFFGYLLGRYLTETHEDLTCAYSCQVVKKPPVVPG